MRRDLGHEQYEWLVNIRLRKHALDVPFFIHVFVGPFDPNPSTWSFEPNFAGSQSVFLKSNLTSGDDLFISGTIPLTNALLDSVNKGSLKSLNPVDVNPFLAKNFQCRLTSTDDVEIPNEWVPSLTISLVSAPVKLPGTMNELPVWGKMVSHIDITTGGDKS